jgi:hypothetical protein
MGRRVGNSRPVFGIPFDAENAAFDASLIEMRAVPVQMAGENWLHGRSWIQVKADRSSGLVEVERNLSLF